MCGKLGHKEKAFLWAGMGPFGKIGQSIEMFESLDPDTKHKYIGAYADAHLIGGGAIRKYTGYDKDEQRIAQRAEDQRNAYFKQQYAPAEPAESAMFVDQAAEIRNRRRRAVLFGVSQLRVPGAGAGGGGYEGANAPVY